jgi:hypothetical protein
MPLHKGTKVMLVVLQSSPELNFKIGVLRTYLHDRQRWVVELPCGRNVNVREANMQTIDVSVKNFYTVFGYPDKSTPALADLVEVCTGKHGRYLVAKQAISKNTLARDDKIRVTMPPDENKRLGLRMKAFIDKQLGDDSELTGVTESFNVPAAYVGKCVQQGWLENDLVRDLMRYDCYSPKVLQETMHRMPMEDFFYFNFWCSEMPEMPADTLWRLQSFLMSHGFLNDWTLTVGISSYAQTSSIRWEWYSVIRSGKTPPPLPNTPEVNGNFMEMPCWLVQEKPQGLDEVHVNDCVIFNESISAGEELLLDYADKYFPHANQHVRNTCPLPLHLLLFCIVKWLDPRVTQALEAHFF